MVWDAFGDVEEQAVETNKELSREDKELDKLIFRVYSTEDGKKLYNFMIKDTLYGDSSSGGGMINIVSEVAVNRYIKEIILRFERAPTHDKK